MAGIGTPTLSSGSSGSVTQGTDPWNVNITQVGSTIFSLGQKAMTASLPVVIASDQSAVPVSANNLDIRDLTSLSDSVEVKQATGTNLHTVIDSGTITTVSTLTSITNTVTVDSELTTADLDTGIGTDTRAVVGLVGSASGGGQLIPGSSANGLLVNLGANNGVTVTGSVTANAGTNLNTSSLLTTSDFTTVFGTASLLTTTQADDIVNTVDTVNSSAFLYGFDGTTWDRLRVNSFAADGQGPSEGLLVFSTNYNFNGSSFDRLQSIRNSTDSTGTGITAAGLLAQFDDTTPSTVTENRFANVRMGSDRVLYMQGQVASDGVDSGNPLKIGFQARQTFPTAVADADRIDGIADDAGRQVIVAGTVRDLRGTQTTTISNSTSETTIVTAGAANVFNDIVALVVSNTSASTNTRIDFRDATAGSVIFSLQAPGNQTTGFAIPGESIPQTTAANNWTAQCATGTTDIRIFVLYEKNK